MARSLDISIDGKTAKTLQTEIGDCVETWPSFEQQIKVIIDEILSEHKQKTTSETSDTQNPTQPPIFDETTIEAEVNDSADPTDVGHLVSLLSQAIKQNGELIKQNGELIKRVTGVETEITELKDVIKSQYCKKCLPQHEQQNDQHHVPSGPKCT